MDINCTDSCTYQTEGKCGLTDLQQMVYTGAPPDGTQAADCPYYCRSRTENR